MEAERRALWMSVVGALIFAGLGFGFSILTDSEAILLDGFFSLIGFFMGLLSRRVLYAGIATLGCFALAGVQLRVAKTTGSQLVAVDAKSWLIDGLMSLVVAIAFGVAFWLSSTGLAHLVPYVDPGLVMLLTLLMIYMRLESTPDRIRL